MTSNTFLELKKIRKKISQKEVKLMGINSCLILEKNYINRTFKSYMYKRLSEYLRFVTELDFPNSFSELIFLELFNCNQTFFNFNLLLHQTIELIVGNISLFNMSNIMIRFFKITSWNFINPAILLKFSSINNSLIEAKGFENLKEYKEKKSYRNDCSKEFFAVKLEKIRINIDKKDYLVSGILINSLFRLNSWGFIGKSEKKVFSELIIRILIKNHNLILLAKFYYLLSEYAYLNYKDFKLSKTCIFLSSIFFRLSISYDSFSSLEKLLKIKIINLFKLKQRYRFTNKDMMIFKFNEKIKKFTQKIEKNIPYLNNNCLDKISKSLKIKTIEETIKKITYSYSSILATNIKNWFKIDSRDLEYHLLNTNDTTNSFLSFDHFRGILYFNLIL